MGELALSFLLFSLGFGAFIASAFIIISLIQKQRFTRTAAQSLSDGLTLFSLFLCFVLVLPSAHPYKSFFLFLFLSFFLLFLKNQMEPSLGLRWIIMITLSVLLTMFFIPFDQTFSFAAGCFFTLFVLLSLLWLPGKGRLVPFIFLLPAVSFWIMGIQSGKIALAGLSALMCGVMAGFVAIRRRAPNFELGETGVLCLGIYLIWLSFESLLKTAFFLNIFVALLLFGMPLFSVTITTRQRGKLLWNMSPLSLLDVLAAVGLKEKDLFRSALTMLLFFCLGAVLLFQLRSLSLLARVFFLVGWSLAGVPLFLALVVLTLCRYEPKRKDRATVLGFSFFGLGKEKVIQELDRFIASGKPHMVVTPDSGSLYRSRQDKNFQSILQQAHLLVPDGFGIYLTARLFQEPVRERIPGIDLMLSLCQLAEDKGYRIFLYGAKPDVLERTKQKLIERFPSLQIAGATHGYEQDDLKIVESIKQAKPHILFVALGVPKQEIWIYRHMETLKVPLSMGVGGSFDVISGTLKRAPRWMQRMGLEWLYRVKQEPWRLRRVSVLFPFFWLVLKERLKKKQP